MVRTLKVFVERKTFLVRLEGEHEGNWCSITEHSRGSIFVLSFEKDAVGWMIEHLTNAIRMKSHLGFNRKFRGKFCVHLMEVGFNNHGRFLRILEFATNRKSSFLIIPEGEKGRGWENLKSALSSMLVVPHSNAVEKGRQYRGERFTHNHVGPLYRSFAKVVSGEGPRGGGLVPVGRWARAVVCECNDDSVKWVEVDRAVARSLGKKGVVTIEALFPQDLRNMRVKERNTVQLRRWSPKENSEIEGKLREGWIELRGLPFHLWSEVYLKKILKLFDLSKARVRITMKDRLILPALIEVTDGDWVFTISIVVVGDEDGRRGSVISELTREAFASHSGTNGGRRGERVRSTAGGRCCVAEDGKMRKGGERGMDPSMPSLNSKKMDDGPVGTKEAGGDRAEGDEVSIVEGCRAYERKAQPLSKPGPKFANVGYNFKGPSGLGLSLGGNKPDESEVSLRREEDSSAMGKGKATSVFLEVQSSSSEKKEVKFSSKKLWSTLFPPSSDRRQGLRCPSEPLLHRKNQADSEEYPKEEASGAGSQAERGSSASPLTSRRLPRFPKRCLGEGASSSRDEVALSKFFFDKDREGLLGQARYDLRGSAVMVLPSTPEIRGKGLSFMGNCGLLVAENLEVISSSPTQSPSSSIPPSCGLASSFLSPSVPNLPSSSF
ncbi:hypothetical protein PVL29_022886 [Vitis rotundifolia]|uniref:DUF4283 domain-containing protein n=1 Tax=Vitis rotundifolia TaxID=103349 RepID=A0AA38YWY6_VITRO|nr:hypothetical protein PVL29_022886 [Vitis rotundifolia]